MKLHRLDRSSTNNSSFSAKVNEYPHFLRIWHYHPELELVAILKSEGTYFVGDRIDKFEAGDVVLIGENLPHMWLNDEAYFDQNSNKKAKAIAIHFRHDYLGKQFFETPEMIHLLELFDRAKLGLKFVNLEKTVITEIQNIFELKGYEKSIAFLNILNKLSKHKETEALSSLGFTNTFKITKSENQNKVHAYIFNNFNKDISLEKAAKIAHMNTSAFSRYFKRMNHKTFSRYVTEIRIGYACKLIMEKKWNITGACYESGYKNLSNFNRQFKLIMNCTPSEYLKKLQIISN